MTPPRSDATGPIERVPTLAREREHEAARLHERRRSLLFMYVSACAIGVSTLFVPHSLHFHPTSVGAVIATGLAVAMALALLPRGSVPNLDHVALVYAIAAITAINVVSGSPVAPYSAFYFWPVLFAAWYCEASAALFYGALCAAGLACDLAVLPSTADGAVRWVVHVAAFAVAGGATAWSRMRIDELVRELRIDSATDALTGLANRRDFDASLDKLLTDAARRDAPLSLVFFDLDDFKRINDEYGHSTGDRALRRMARVLLRRCRIDDVVARIGGDEFAVILADTVTQDARRFAEGILRALGDEGSEEPRVRASVGIAEHPLDARSRAKLLDVADRATYAAKRAGRNRVVCASDGRRSPSDVTLKTFRLDRS